LESPEQPKVQETPIHASNPRVSVVLAVHDGGPFVEASIRSMLDQTWRDLEVVVVDDGSTDDTPQVLRRVAATDPRVRVLTNGTNVGLASSLNRGISAARGQLVARMDADDLCPPHRLEVQVAFLDERPDIDVVGSTYEEFGTDVDARRPGKLGRGGLRGGCPPLPHPTIMVRASAFKLAGDYDPRFSVAEEHELFVRMHHAGLRFHLMEEPLLWRRLHGGNVSTLQRRRQLGQNLHINFLAVTRYGVRLDRSGWRHVAKSLALWSYLTLRLDRVLDEQRLRRLVGRADPLRAEVDA
jgi:glycosyltransferase involved in cell wall biosynthesis